MVTKNPFIAMIVSALILPYTLNSMHITKKFPHAFYKQKALRYCTKQNSSLVKEGSIVPYKRERDEKAVSTLVWKNLPKLTSEVTEDNKQEQFDIIMARVNRNASITKVYVNNEKAIGFINYTIFKPWYNKYIPFPVKPNGYINLLAVDNEHQGKKIGSILLNDALDDCNKSKTYKTTLYITDEKLTNYYDKFGFYPVDKPGMKFMELIKHTEPTFVDALSKVIAKIFSK